MEFMPAVNPLIVPEFAVDDPVTLGSAGDSGLPSLAAGESFVMDGESFVTDVIDGVQFLVTETTA